MANPKGNPNWKKGQPKTSGRKKGSPNKIPKNIKENFEAVFEKLGGVEGFFAWAAKSTQTKGSFYQMYAKMLPSNVGIDHSGEIKVPLKLIIENNGNANDTTKRDNASGSPSKSDK